jgi:VWFA-related protein
MFSRAAACFLGATVCLSATSRHDQQQSAPTFRASTELVEVDVNVTDKGGAFVPDLTTDDFTVFDQGKRTPVEIAYIVHSGNVTPVSAGAAVRANAELPRPPSARRTLIFYFDVTHMTYGQLRRAGAGAEHFLASEFGDGDIAGILIGDRMVNDRLTTDRKELLAGIRRASGATQTKTPTGSLKTNPEAEAGAAASRSADAAAEIDERLDDAEKSVVSGPTGSAELSTLETLERLVEQLSRVPGRKNVVYFSGGFLVAGTQPGSNKPEQLLSMLRRISQKAAHSDVHIYSIDVVGLDKGIGSSAILTATQPAFSDSSAANAAHVRGDPGPEDLLTQLAADTGGLLFLNQNYYGDALRTIDEDTSDYYVLAFRPDASDKNVRKGAFRNLKVTVERPGVKVRARKGYVVN